MNAKNRFGLLVKSSVPTQRKGQIEAMGKGITLWASTCRSQASFWTQLEQSFLCPIL